MQFAILGSGSKGNASVICGGKSRVLVDCGFSRKETEARLQRIGMQASELDAILVTHEHSDHVAGVARLARPHGIPVYATYGTASAAKLMELDTLNLISVHQSFQIGDLTIQPYPVPHDAREPVQFVIAHQHCRIGILSDAGAVTAHMQDVLSGCDALLLECNHCPELLQNGPYPPALKDRVARSGQLFFSLMWVTARCCRRDRSSCPSRAADC